MDDHSQRTEDRRPSRAHLIAWGDGRFGISYRIAGFEGLREVRESDPDMPALWTELGAADQSTLAAAMPAVALRMKVFRDKR